MSPLANSYLSPEKLSAPRSSIPFTCTSAIAACWCRLEEVREPRHIFGDYAYFSSYSESWLEHARLYVERMIDRFGLDATTQVVELASTTGTSCGTSTIRGVPVLESSLRRTSPGRDRARDPDRGPLLRTSDGEGARGAAACVLGCFSGNNVLAQCRT